eukprot:8197427-Pyramimonas_sp.AAC.1
MASQGPGTVQGMPRVAQDRSKTSMDGPLTAQAAPKKGLQEAIQEGPEEVILPFLRVLKKMSAVSPVRDFDSKMAQAASIIATGRFKRPREGLQMAQ